MGNNGYRYHVFLSYKRARRDNGRVRDDDVETWVRSFFERELQNKLTNALGDSAQIFCDQFEIRAGEEWEKTIVGALRSSLCLVPVWSPLYFRSRWCVSEWGSFRHGAKRPVVPVRWQSGITLPPAAKAVQGTDFGKFTYTADSFRKSDKYLEFQDLVKAFAADVAKAINQAPEFNPKLPIVIPDVSPGLESSNVCRLDDLPDRDQMLVTKTSRVRRSDIALAA
jgi:hypothetical protein